MDNAQKTKQNSGVDWSEVSSYIPVISGRTSDMGYGIEAELPKKEEDRQLMRKVFGSKIFRDHVQKQLEQIFAWREPDGESLIEIRLDKFGPSFETNKKQFHVNMDSSSNKQYTSLTEHNVDAYVEADVLVIAASALSKNLYYVMGQLKKDPEFLSDKHDIGEHSDTIFVQLGLHFKEVERMQTETKQEQSLIEEKPFTLSYKLKIYSTGRYSLAVLIPKKIAKDLGITPDTLLSAEIDEKGRIAYIIGANQQDRAETKEGIYKVRPHPTGRRGGSIEVTIPKEIRTDPRLDLKRGDTLTMKVESQNRLVYERTLISPLSEPKIEPTSILQLSRHKQPD